MGVFDAPTDNSSALYFNWDYLRDSLPAGDASRDMVSSSTSRLRIKTRSQALPNRLNVFADSPYPTKSEPEQAFMLSFVSFLGNLKLFLAAICGAVTFTMLLIRPTHSRCQCANERGK